MVYFRLTFIVLSALFLAVAATPFPGDADPTATASPPPFLGLTFNFQGHEPSAPGQPAFPFHKRAWGILQSLVGAKRADNGQYHPGYPIRTFDNGQYHKTSTTTSMSVDSCTCGPTTGIAPPTITPAVGATTIDSIANDIVASFFGVQSPTSPTVSASSTSAATTDSPVSSAVDSVVTNL